MFTWFPSFLRAGELTATNFPRLPCDTTTLGRKILDRKSLIGMEWSRNSVNTTEYSYVDSKVTSTTTIHVLLRSNVFVHRTKKENNCQLLQ